MRHPKSKKYVISADQILYNDKECVKEPINTIQDKNPPSEMLFQKFSTKNVHHITYFSPLYLALAPKQKVYYIICVKELFRSIRRLRHPFKIENVFRL